VAWCRFVTARVQAKPVKFQQKLTNEGDDRNEKVPLAVGMLRDALEKNERSLLS
jgi:hypothetical protein